MLLRLLLLISVVLTFATARAQDDKEQKAAKVPEFCTFVGPLLPNQITGVTEILPSAGVLYSIPNKMGFFELGGLASNAKGVTYYNAFFSIRSNIPMEDLIGIIYAGLDFHRHNQNDPISGYNSSDFTNTFGGHIGGGMMAKLGGELYFRSDMKFNLNPGTSLFIGFGFSLGIPPSGEGGDQGAK